MLNQVLTMPGFLQAFDGDFRNENSKKNKSVSGQKLLDAIKGKKEQSKAQKGQAQQFINCNIFVGLDKKTGALVYFNLDAILGRDTSKLSSTNPQNANPVGYIDKFYGFGQSLIIKNKIYNLSKEQGK